MTSFRKDLNDFVLSLKHNLVALISLVVAVVALTFNTDRANVSETQRNIREASFSVLQELNQLQLLIDQAHYGYSFEGVDTEYGNPIAGWARVNYIVDLAMIIPSPVPESAKQLHQVWSEQIPALGISAASDEARLAASLNSNQQITESIKAARASVKDVILSLE